jgi:nucleoside-diphosphate-sugar epimerase
MGLESVLITGAGGFLGSHLTERFLNRGVRVIAVDNFSTGLPSNRDYLQSLSSAQDRLFFVEADVCQPWESWLKELPDFVTSTVTHVFHFASPASPPLYQELALETMWVNSIGTDRAMTFADSVGARVVFASTSEIYGDPEISPQPETYWGNVNTVGVRSCYDESKRFGESLIFTHNLKKKTKHGFVRIFNTYGPRMNPSDGRVVINLLVQAIQRQPLTVYGDGKQTRSFCYVDDLCAGIELYARSGMTEPVNIGNDREFTILELAQVVQKMFSDRDLKITFQPMPPDDPKKRRPDLKKAKLALSPWEPKISLEEGLTKMRTWLETEMKRGG